jgi:hypothetical protein
MKRKIKENVLLQTLFNDLIGKDSQRGITLTYGWLANQVGHFSLGFIPACIAYGISGNLFWSCIGVGSSWTLFESFNILSPLFKTTGKGGRIFSLKWGNIVFDTITDLIFFWTGCYSMYIISGEFTMLQIIPGFLLLIGLLIGTRYWYKTKLFQQRAMFPFQFRLSQWNGKLLPDDKRSIDEFLIEGPKSVHYLIFGEQGSGKTALAVGMGNEFAIQHHSVRYSTFFKWVSNIHSKQMDKDENSWNWDEASLLIIDDVNPGIPIEANKFGASEVFGLIHSSGSATLERLISRNCFWILGAIPETDKEENWVDMLIELGMERNQIVIIHLNKI